MDPPTHIQDVTIGHTSQDENAAFMHWLGICGEMK